MRKHPAKNESPQKLIESVDFYFENGLMVLTEKFLRDRGYCCGNGCRHCPYYTETAEAEGTADHRNRRD